MDTSKEYIKMCEKAEEIQKLWEPKFGDFITPAIQCLRRKTTPRYIQVVIAYGPKDIFRKKSPIVIRAGNPNQTRDTKYKNDKLWLPRQDQLQKMIKLIDYGLNDCIKILDDGSYAIGSYDGDGCFEGYVYGNTMEQLWLAFVMKEKYDKVWDGKEWIKEKKR